MKISFSGVQCTGKSTLINEMKNSNNFNEYLFMTECIRDLNKKGFKINENGDDDTQTAVMCMHLINLDKSENAIMDRCLLDGMCYAEWSYNHGKISEENYKFCHRVFWSNINSYDLIFYLVPEFEMVEDGVRSLNKEFRDEVKSIFDKYVNLINDKLKVKVITLHGSVEERMKQIYDSII